MKFVTMAGRAKHLRTSIICKCWWEARLEDLREHGQQRTSDASSSEVASDEDCTYLPDGCDEELMDLDQALEEPLWYGSCGVEDTECPSTGDTEFTSSPSGVDLRSTELISCVELPVLVEEYPGAAQVVDESKNLYTQIWEGDKLYESRKIGGAFYPFSGVMEWEVVEWLHSLDVPMEKIDHFFELEYVSSIGVI